MQLSPIPDLCALDQRRARFAWALGATFFTSVGCGGGVPLLHAAHPLAPGQTAFAAGVSDHFVLGEEQEALDAARKAPGGPPSLDARFARGLLVAVSEVPRLSPFGAARVGVAGDNELGLSYAGRALRGDGRHAFVWGKSALSLGLGLTASGLGHTPLDLPGTKDSRANGLGVDVPVLYGYQTDAELISVWAGVRASFDSWSGSVVFDDSERIKLDARRIAAGPVLGFKVGLPPLWAALEVSLDYASVTGTLDGLGAHQDADLVGWSVRPAGALITKF